MSCAPGQKTPRGFTAVTMQSLQSSLARRLIPVADRVRDIYTKLGMRPYILRLIKTRSTQGIRGRAVEEITFTRLFDPTPLVLDLSSLNEILEPAGLNEVGTVRVEQISGIFTEDQLRGFDDDGNPPEDGESVFFEIEFVVNGDKRRFFPATAPMYYADKLEWIILLERSNVERERDGSLA